MDNSIFVCVSFALRGRCDLFFLYSLTTLFQVTQLIVLSVRVMKVFINSCCKGFHVIITSVLFSLIQFINLFDADFLQHFGRLLELEFDF